MLWFLLLWNGLPELILIDLKLFFYLVSLNVVHKIYLLKFQEISFTKSLFDHFKILCYKLNKVPSSTSVFACGEQVNQCIWLSITLSSAMSDFLKLCHISLLNCTIFRNSAFLRSNYISILCFPRDMSYRIAWIIERLVYWYWYIGHNSFHHKIILHIRDTESLDICGY